MYNNIRALLQRAQIANYNQQYQRTLDTLNFSQMSQNNSILNQTLPKTFLQLYKEPECYYKLQKFYHVVDQSFTKYFYPKNQHIHDIPILTPRLKQLKRKSADIFKEFYSYSRLSLSIIISEFLESHIALKNANEKILYGFPENPSCQNLSQEKLDNIFKSRSIYKSLSKIKQIWKKYHNLHKNQNRRRYGNSKKIHIITYQQQIQFLYSQKFMAYSNNNNIYNDLDIQKQIDSIQKNIQSYFEIENKGQFLLIKDLLEKKVFSIYASHNDFCKTIQYILQNILMKVFQHQIQIQNNYNDKYAYALDKLGAVERIVIVTYKMLNEKIQKLQQNPQKKQKIKDLVRKIFYNEILNNLKNLFALNEYLFKIQYTYVQQKKQIESCYQLINQIFNHLDQFYVNKYQQKIVMSMQDLTLSKISQNSDFDNSNTNSKEQFNSMFLKIQSKIKLKQSENEIMVEQNLQSDI